MTDSLLINPYRVAPAEFSPWAPAYPTPTDAVWADDPLGTYADGVATPTLRNQSGGGDPTQATAASRAIHRASVAALGNRAAWEFDGTDDFYVGSTNNVAQPFRLLAVVKLASTGVARTFLGRDSTSTAHGYGVEAGNAWRQSWGTLLSGGAADTNGHVVSGFTDGASSTIDVDGANVAPAGAVGTGTIANFVVGAGSNSVAQARFWAGHIAYIGIYPAAASLGALITDLRAYYGI